MKALPIIASLPDTIIAWTKPDIKGHLSKTHKAFSGWSVHYTPAPPRSAPASAHLCTATGGCPAAPDPLPSQASLPGRQFPVVSAAVYYTAAAGYRYTTNPHTLKWIWGAAVRSGSHLRSGLGQILSGSILRPCTDSAGAPPL